MQKITAVQRYVRDLALSAGCLTLAVAPSLALDIKGAAVTTGSPAASAVQARLREAEMAIEAQRLDLAKASYEAAIQAAPQDPSGWLGLARISRLSGDWPEAQRTLARAQALAPNALAVLRAKGELAADLRQYAAAEAAFQAVLQVEPRNVQVLCDLAVVLGKTGRADEARRMLDEAQKTRGVVQSELLSLALAYQSVGQPHAALALFDKILLARPESLAAQTGRGDSLYMLGRYAPALDAYLVAMGLAAPGPQIHFKRARALEAMQWLPEADAAYRDALRLDPAHVPSHHALRALTLQRGESLGEVLALAKQGLARSPSAAMYDVLGAVLLARKDVDGARKALEQAVALAPDREEFRRRLLAAGGSLPSSPAANVAAAQPAAGGGASVVPAKSPNGVPVAAAAKAVAAVAASAPQAMDARQVVTARMAQWVEAWSAKDVNRYLSFYAVGFEPAKRQSRADWERERRLRLNKTGEIRVTVSAPVVVVQGDTVRVTFDQTYRAADFQDSTRKELLWTLDAGQWRIRRESAL